ncbi:hypothetical protein [Paenibacillus polymyxa]|uniref:hypothetical protein n=1 Tax=Paenibacillus polymyxa TaxID=1406 RepID=UPI002AB5BF38|nr:hypothetical protein [Paenibacillus polymyxa]MDY8023029.1 hypothetical protein [Paenibacillus polymyxa]
MCLEGLLAPFYRIRSDFHATNSMGQPWTGDYLPDYLSFSPNDYKEIDKIWNGVYPEDRQQFKKSKTTKLLPSERYSLVFSIVPLYTMVLLLQKYD